MNPICSPCKREMHCVKTGKLAVFQQSHVYRGDEFECPTCKSRVLVTAGQPTHEPDVLDSHRADEIIEMPEPGTSIAAPFVYLPREVAERAAQHAAFFIAYSSIDQDTKNQAADDCGTINDALGTPL